MIRHTTHLIIVSLIAAFSPCGLAHAQPDPQSNVERPSAVRDLARAINIIAKYHAKEPSNQQLTTWAVDGLYAHHKQPVPVDIKKRLANLKGTAGETQSLLDDVFAPFQARKDFDAHKAVEACVDAIFAKLEPAAAPELRGGLVPNPGCVLFDNKVGVGLKIQVDRESGMLRVVTPLHNGPAHKAGIRAGDLITHIRIHGDADAHGNELAPPRTNSTKGMTIEEAERLLRGKSGTRVTLVVVPAK
ncbi:MAG TPA: hypothetical protein VE988_06995 [Gemmataceae bacterium]|nr:hypothetical protein [Gemmataceae bacterium]